MEAIERRDKEEEEVSKGKARKGEKVEEGGEEGYGASKIKEGEKGKGGIDGRVGATEVKVKKDEAVKD